jgi:cytosine/adenosine deaminase-related metal-dependent hydrolase
MLSRWVPMTDMTSGLVCGHHHLYSALARGMPAPPQQPTDFRSILEQVWWRLDTALDLEMLRWSAMLGAVEALQCGTTAIIDHHESPNAIEGSLDVIAQACAEVGVRVSCACRVTDRHGPDGARQVGGENGLPPCGGRGYRRAPRSCDGDAGRDLAGAGVHIRAEGVDGLLPASVERLATEDWLIVHCVHLDQPLLTIAHNPAAT